MSEHNEHQPSIKSGWLHLRPDWIALIMSLGALVWNAAVYPEKVSNNLRRIEALEQREEGRSDKLNTIDVRTAKIEAKLDILMGEKPFRPMSEGIEKYQEESR